MCPQAAQKLRDRVKNSRRGGGEEGLLSKVQSAATQIDEAAADATKPAPKQEGVQQSRSSNPPSPPPTTSGPAGGAFSAFSAQLAIVLFLVYFLLVTDDLYKRKIVKIAGPTLTKKKISVQIMDEINQQISGFLRVQVITSLVVAVATSAGAVVVRRRQLRHLGPARRHLQLDPLPGPYRRHQRPRRS